MYEQQDMGNPEIPSIETAPIVQHRLTVCATDVAVWASYENKLFPCHVGDKVHLNCLNHPAAIKQKSYDTEWTILSNHQIRAVAVEGYIGPMWIIGPYMASADKSTHTPDEMKIRKALKEHIAPRTIPSRENSLPNTRSSLRCRTATFRSATEMFACSFVRKHRGTLMGSYVYLLLSL